MRFGDRREAGTRLARELARYRKENPVVLALPRGGIEVAYPIALALDAPLDVLCVRKIGAPGHEEMGLGAVAEDGILYLDHDLIAGLGIDEEDLGWVIAKKRREVEQRTRDFRHGRPRIPLTDRTVIVVDDGIAMGGTMEAALLAVRSHKPARIVFAVPVAAPISLERLMPLADDAAVLQTPEDLLAVGEWYEDFHEVPDERVIELLDCRAESIEHAAG